MRYQLLEIVNRILESMMDERVSTISEHSTSIHVGNIVKECYFDIIGWHNPDEQSGPFKLDASTDSTKPVLMTVPTYVSDINWVKYNKNTLNNPEFVDIRLVSLEEFLYLTDARDPADTNVGAMDVVLNSDTFKIKYLTDSFPTYYTFATETTLIFDSFDSTVENTLTEVRTLCSGSIIPEFNMVDTWVPNLDARQFQLLLQEAKRLAFVEIKQTQNANAEERARRNNVKAQKDKYTNGQRFSNKQRTYNFGRR